MTSLPSEGLNLLDEEDAETWAVPGQYIQLTDDADTPARRAGLENGDLIIQVNGSRVLGLGHDAVVNHLAGVGNNFTLELGTWPVSVFVCVFKFPHFDGVLLRNCLKTIPSLFFFPFSRFLLSFFGCGRGIGRRGDTTGPNFKHRVADVLSTLMDRDATNRPDYVTDPMDVLPRWFPKSEMKDDPIFKPATIPASVQPTPRTITSYHHPVYINTSYHHPVYINTPYHQHLDTSYQHLVYPHLPRTYLVRIGITHHRHSRDGFDGTRSIRTPSVCSRGGGLLLSASADVRSAGDVTHFRRRCLRNEPRCTGRPLRWRSRVRKRMQPLPTSPGQATSAL